MSTMECCSEKLANDGSVTAETVNLDAATTYALQHHETEPCLRAQEMDFGRVPLEMKIATTSFWSVLTALAVKNAVNRYSTLPSDIVGELTSLALHIRSINRSAIVGSTLRLIAHGSTIVLALLSYCPVGRLAFGRPLRRMYVRLAAKLRAKDTSQLMVVVSSLVKLVTSRQGILGLINVLVLPSLIKVLSSARFPGAGALRNIVSGLQLLLTTTSATALLTAVCPSHIVPSNPWRDEPDFELAEPELAETGKIGVLVCNLGTTPTPKPNDVAAFLREFLSDPRVVEIYPSVWQTVLYGLIVPIRKYTSGQLYARLFATVASTQGESPLLYYTRRFADRIGLVLGDRYQVAIGMRYGEPSIRHGLDHLKAKGCQKIIALPEYPQYSSTTTASIYDELFAQLSRYRNVPTLRVVPPYYEHPAYISSLADVARAYLKDKPPVEKYIISFHGIPERYHLRGDPYPWHCERTASALARAMEWPADQWVMTYQSVFGKDPWLRPATDDTVESLAQQGLKRIAIICPGFLTDCLETVDENGTENADLFVENGGESVELIPCLNDEQVWCSKAAEIIAQEAQGW
eukprot:TRINITY_DN8325_c0_g2_i1.p1 TRINITY_DN8325_c0_g2~~TRINITY_DN8325_c0_g2_i1.p1  ORF type:complete len:577 (+),score=108.31 TRINITY_DN8325_c0_g2_i1:140-1870(+)